MDVIYENRYLVTLVLNFPLSYIYTFLNPTQKQIFSIVCSTLMTIGLFSFYSFLRVVLPSLLVYYLTLYNGSNKMNAFVCLVIGSSSLVYTHYMRLRFKEKRQVVSKLDLDDYQKEYQIDEFPSLLEYMSFMMFYIHFVVGPAIEFKTYQNYLKKTKFQLPTTEIYKNLGLVVLLAYLQSLPLHFKDFYQDWFIQAPFLYKIVYVQISGIIVRSKYYCAWKIGHIQSLLVGIGYDDTATNKCENVNVFKVEFGENIKMMMDNWNIFTANWLRRYIYNRVPMFKLELTLFTSAIWHGFYPGYYLCFIGAVPAQQASRLCRKILKPMAAKFQLAYDIIGWFLSIFCLNFLVVAFQLKRLDYGLLVWKSMYFCGIIGPVLVYAGLYAYTKSLKSKKKKKE
ncbi:lysophospholipid acyltransferase [Boothiomyces sp. JEL0838]|nr:lysophospholipid acyltransferase [Boothiomyces sp. JEL0838]